MIQRYSSLVFVSLGIVLLVLLVGGVKHDEIYDVVQPQWQKMHTWAFSEPVPWSPSFRVPNMSRGDVLRRRDFSSKSLRPVPIKRPPNPLQGLDLSESFQVVWHRILALNANLPREYRESLESLAKEDKMAQCGPWVKEYTLRHEEILRQYNDSELTLANVQPPAALGSRPGRLIAACFKDAGQCGGLGDRVFGHASTFMMSLLMDRAFLMHWSHDFPVLVEDTFESPYINWAWQAPPPSEHNLDASVDPGDHRLGNKHAMFIQWPGDMLDKFYTHASRDTIEKETFMNGETLTVQGNKGMIVRTLQDTSTWQSKSLREMGMTTDNAWSCVLNYLVNPIPDTARLIAKYQALLRMPSVFSVGVQVRAGDWVFQPDKRTGLDWENVKQYDYFMKCAADAAVAFADPAVHKHFVIFLVTDNDMFAHRAAKEPRYFMDAGWQHPTIPDFEPLVISMGQTPIHLEKGDDEKDQGKHNSLSAKMRHLAMQTSLIDNYVFDATDIQLICSWSGFGLLSVLRSALRNGHSSIPMGSTGPEGGVEPLSFEGYPCNSTRAFWSPEQYAEKGSKFAVHSSLVLEPAGPDADTVTSYGVLPASSGAGDASLG